MSRTIRRTFAPSYDADSLADYEKQVREGPKMRESPSRLETGFTHIQVRGGRGRVAGWIADAPPMSTESAARLAQAKPVWDRRTQSIRTPITPKTAEDRLAERIRTGLVEYLEMAPQRAYGLLVPDQPGGLIAAGVPPRAARLLVQRAAGKLFLLQGPQEPRPDLLATFTEAVGTPTMNDAGTRVTMEVWRVGVVRALFFRVGATAQKIMDETELAGENYKTWRKSHRTVDADRKWARLVFTLAERRVTALLRAAKVEQGTLEVVISRSVAGREERRTIKVEFPPSRSTPVDRARLRPRYRTMQDVGIADLPRVLSRLSRRKTHTALENSMSVDELFWLEQYDEGPFGGSASLPVARRNGLALTNMAGRPGLHGMERGPLGNRDMMKLGKADLQALVASGSKSEAAAARKELLRRQKNKKISGAQAQPKSRKTERSRKLRSTKVKKEREAKKAARTHKAAAKPARNGDAAKAMRLFHSGHASSLAEAWDIVKGGRARRNSYLDSPTAQWLPYHDPNYEQVLGQFGVSEAFTTGIQPMSRRNSKSRKSRKSRY